ncbi:TolC family protein [Amaricoccus macauensis]|uniref:TolC family protein n=1 Tax=Amaricoccus macauensis TaxID=57001 RepID=UPI003C79C353
MSGKTISSDTAVQVALINNRGLQASFAELGLSSGDLWEVAMGPVPTVGVSVSGIAGDVTRTLEATLINSLLDLATSRSRTEIGEIRFRQAELAALAESIALAVETRQAWIEAVGAFEAAALVAEAKGTAEASSELASQLGRTGAMNRADQAREYAFSAELAGEEAEARLEAQLAKQRLIRLMGLWGSDVTVYVPDALPPLPGSPRTASDIERLALTNRVDLASGRLELEAVAREYRLTGQTYMISDVELGAGLEIERENSETDKGPVLDIDFEIPLYDTGGLVSKRGQMAYLKAANTLAQQAIDARSEARMAHKAVTGRHAVARHWRDEVLPLRGEIDEEALKSYSGMITSTFELIEDARDGLEAQLGAAEAKRDYWLAETMVTAAIWGGEVSPSAGEGDDE